jgi:hypothetical protein
MAPCRALQEGKETRKEVHPCDGCDSSVYRGPVLLSRQASYTTPPAVPVGPPEISSSSGSGSGRSATEAKALKIHSEAERRRRERINAHLATLRRMIHDTKQVGARPVSVFERAWFRFFSVVWFKFVSILLCRRRNILFFFMKPRNILAG